MGTDDERDQRRDGPTLDLDALEAHAESLYLHRFVEAVRRARGEHGRYLRIRPGDELAIRAAGDGSAAYLDDVLVDPSSGNGSRSPSRQ
jgi:hypothetical protein